MVGRIENDDPTRTENPEFKDALGEVYVDHLENLIGANATDAANIIDGFLETLRAVSQHVLFSEPPGENQVALAEEVAALISGFINRAQTGSPAADYTIKSENRLSSHACSRTC